VCARASALPAGTAAIVILEVPEQADEQELDTAADVSLRWLHRGGGPAGESAALAAALSDVSLPAGRGHAYLLGEAKVVLRLREVAAGRGLAHDQVSAKAYWGRGRANASHGEPAKDA
jgi:NADPH-dependent ferric siderophore reductase